MGTGVASANNGGAPSAPNRDLGIPASNPSGTRSDGGGGGPASAGVGAETAAAAAADSGATASKDKEAGAAAGNHPNEHSSGGGIGNAWTGGAQLAGCGGFDPVVNWNDGLTLNTGAIEYQSEGDSVDLRAQVAGKQVASYAWDTSQAATATQVSATNSYKLTFRWGNIYSGNYADRIRLTVTYTDQTQEVEDYNFRVINDGTGPMGSGGGSPVSATWPEVVAPDKFGPQREAVSGDRYSLSKQTSELNTVHLLPSYGDPAALALRLSCCKQAKETKCGGTGGRKS